MTETRRVGGESWGAGSPDPPAKYAEPAGVVPMPAEPVPPEPDPKTQRRARPGLPSTCERCLWAPSGACPDHADDFEEYDAGRLLRSAGVPPRPHEDRIEQTFYDAFDWH